LHTPVSPTGRGSDALNLNLKGKDHGKTMEKTDVRGGWPNSNTGISGISA
jgi:hypothetical protein